MSKSFPPCYACGQESTVIVNGKSACRTHIDQAMRSALSGLRAALDQNRSGDA